MKIKNVCYLPSGKIFILDNNGYTLECTEMRDVSVQGKEHKDVRISLDPRIIWKHLVPYSKKWLLTVSTQRGCGFSCKFCDVAKLHFKGNLTKEEILEQVYLIIHNTPYVDESEKVKIGFARMGEPAQNLDNVLDAMKELPNISSELGKNFTWLPCFNTILPNKSGKCGAKDVLDRVLDVKNNFFNGNLHLQISCNSTDEKQRRRLFDNADVMPLKEIIEHINTKTIINRTVTLNFIVMKGFEIDVKKLSAFGLNKDKFAVKLIPLNSTDNAENHKLKTYANYYNLWKLEKLANEFRKREIPVVMDAIAKCEEAGLCCGQLAQIYQ